MARLEIRGAEKRFDGGTIAADRIDLTVEDGELFVIVGPSGSGKSTLLRLVAGLERLDGGSIHLDGTRVDRLEPNGRDVAMVFQDQVLFPHLDAFENIAFGLNARGVSKGEVKSRVIAAAGVLGIGDCLGRRPSTLSGGQRRRVALGRALVLRPGLFLLDEPFSGLDAPLRASTRAELAGLNRSLGISMLLVTHDQAEAMALGDRLAILDRGRVVQVGRPLDLYDQPDSRLVALFLGQPPINLLPCRIVDLGHGPILQFENLETAGARAIPDALRGGATRNLIRFQMGIRPEFLSIRPASTPDPASSDCVGMASIRRMEPLGHETLTYLDLGPYSLTARLASHSSFRAGDRVFVDFVLDRAIWFHAETGNRLR